MQTTSLRASYIIIKEKRLVIEIVSGVLTLDSMKQFKLQESFDVHFSPDYDLLGDARDLILESTICQVSDYVDYVIENGSIIGNRKNASLISTLNQKVYMEYFLQLNKTRNLLQNLRLFTKVDDALSWLDKGITLEEYQSIVAESIKNPQFIYYNN